MRRCMFLFSLMLLTGMAAAAQDMPRTDLFLGYTYTRVYNSNGDRSNSNGGTAAIAFYPTQHVGLVADFGGSTSNGFTNSTTGVHTDSSSHSFRFLFGPRFRFGNDKITPYVHALFGGVHRSDLDSATGTVLVPAETVFGFAAGGGVDFKASKHFSIRAVEVDYLYTRFSPSGMTNHQNDVSISTGFVIH